MPADRWWSPNSNVVSGSGTSVATDGNVAAVSAVFAVAIVSAGAATLSAFER